VTSKNLLLTSFSPFRKDGLCTTQRGCCSAHLPTDMNFHGNTPVDVFHDRTPLICPTKTCSVPLSAKTGKVVCTSSSNRGPPRQDAAHLSNRKPHPATVDPPTGRHSALTAGNLLCTFSSPTEKLHCTSSNSRFYAAKQFPQLHDQNPDNYMQKH
jgi:hypothetical protein